MTKPHKERWALVFQAEGPGQGTAMRVKLLLKAALRQFGLRCVDMAITPDQGQKSGVVPDQANKTRNRMPVDARSGIGWGKDTPRHSDAPYPVYGRVTP